MEQELTTRTKTSLPAGAKPILETLVIRGKYFDRWTVGKLPVITLETKSAAEQSIVVISQNLIPANPEGTKAAIFTLMQHYYVSDLPEQVHLAIATDWIACLVEYPAWAIEKSRIDWMKNNKRKPTPSEIVNLCDKAISKDKAMKRQCELILEAEFTPPPKQELNPEEHEKMKKRIDDILKTVKKNLT